MGFVDDHQIPRGIGHIGCLVAGELEGADDNGIALERTKAALLDLMVVGLGLQNPARQEKLFRKLLMPLLPKVGRRDDQNAPFPFRPFLGEYEPGLDGFPQSHFIRQQRTFGKWRLECEQGGIHLMRIQINLRPCHGPSQFLKTVRRTPLRQFIGKIFGMEVRQLHSTHPSCRYTNIRDFTCIPKTKQSNLVIMVCGWFYLR